KSGKRVPTKAAPARRRQPTTKRSTHLWLSGVVGFVLIALGMVFVLNRSGSTDASSYHFNVGDPGPGARAPAIDLQSTQGGTFDLASMRGQTTLLYFQEGLTCQPCWDQLVDIQNNIGQFKTLGIDQVVSITTDPINQITQKVQDEGITEPVLSDPTLAVSSAYSANSYGMMGNSRDGHTFVLVGPDGTIRWRADFGGAPDYTMYVPVDALITDIQQ